MNEEKLEQLQEVFKLIVISYFAPLGYYNKSIRHAFTEDDMVNDLLREVKIRINNK